MVSKRKTKHRYSYNLFFKLNYQSFRRDFPLMKYQDVHVILGKIWKKLPVERKKEYPKTIEDKISPRKRVKSKRTYQKPAPTTTMVTRSSSRLRESSLIASSDVISSEVNLAQSENDNVLTAVAAEKAIEKTDHLVDACGKKPISKPSTENCYSQRNLEIQVDEIMEVPNEVNSNEVLPSGPSSRNELENAGIVPFINGATSVPMNALIDINLCMEYLDNFYYTMRHIVFPGLLGSREVMATVEREAIQKQIQQDWANREYIEVISGSIKKIADFLNSFDMSCRSRIETLNEKLTSLERKIEYLEARVTKGETLT